LAKSYWSTWRSWMTFVCFIQVYMSCKYTRCVSGWCRIAWNYFQLQQNCLYMMLKAKSAKRTAVPPLTLGVLKVKYVSCYKYLGIVLDIELSDDKDIQRQIRYQYEVVNKLRASFSHVWTQWKMHSFVPSVGPCMHHNYWCDFKKAYIPWLRAVYNFGCRALYNLPWRASVSSYQVQCSIPTFETLLKNVYLFLERCKESNNVWLRTLLQSDCLYQY